ncbi:hypothetical protein [Lacticaseibacillus yichunensis]|uniref:Uncharacterized protein n=1 Tax=Lacticaseibacillus yichunensis TaxID=2486015 RepID=A0ABW4CUR6_9LACO|nr:hypothetical protein [Lacticaseibacillus yichunensis]
MGGFVGWLNGANQNIQAVADAIQALVVILSIGFGAIRYFQGKRSKARLALIQMLNLLDEFPLLVNDAERFKYKESQSQHGDDRLGQAQEPNWADMVEDVKRFREEFRTILNELWSTLDASQVFFHRTDTETLTVLNNSTNVMQALSVLISDLTEGSYDHLQNQKELVRTYLTQFAEALCSLAAKKKVFQTSAEGAQYYPVLSDYSKWFAIVADEVTKAFATDAKPKSSPCRNFILSTPSVRKRISHKPSVFRRFGFSNMRSIIQPTISPRLLLRR